MAVVTVVNRGVGRNVMLLMFAVVSRCYYTQRVRVSYRRWETKTCIGDFAGSDQDLRFD